MGWDATKTDPISWAAKMKDAPREAINAFAFKVFEGVTMSTPVDTGCARQNWNLTLNAETDEYDLSKKKGGHVLTEGKKVIESAKCDDTIFIQNSVPYIGCLEYGLYPSPPKHGGVNSKGQPKTVGGFSSQATAGMVGKTLAKADKLFEQVLKAMKGNN